MNTEKLEAYALGAVGLARGLYEVSTQELDQSTKAWLAIGASVIAYEILCDKNQMLSEGWDRIIDRHPVAGRVLPLYTAAHLANLLPERYDLFHRASVVVGKVAVGAPTPPR